MNLFSEFLFIPYQIVRDLKFKENEKNIGLIFNDNKEEYKNYGGGKIVRFNNFSNDLQIYFNDNDEFIGIHFFKSISFILNDKLYKIDFENFKKDDLITLSDDFVLTAEEEGKDFTSKKLGIDFYFSDEGKLEAVLFMNEDYYAREINN